MVYFPSLTSIPSIGLPPPFCRGRQAGRPGRPALSALSVSKLWLRRLLSVTYGEAALTSAYISPATAGDPTRPARRCPSRPTARPGSGLRAGAHAGEVVLRKRLAFSSSISSSPKWTILRLYSCSLLPGFQHHQNSIGRKRTSCNSGCQQKIRQKLYFKKKK